MFDAPSASAAPPLDRYLWSGQFSKARDLVKGDAANDMLGIVMDPNVHIQESKAATCDIRPGRR